MPGRSRLHGTDVLQRDDSGLLTTVVDGELVALSVEAGACYGLDGIGTRIWELLAEPCSLDSLCEQLTREFEVEQSYCREDVLEFLEELRAEGMVVVSAAR